MGRICRKRRFDNLGVLPESRIVKTSKDFCAAAPGPASVPYIYPTSLTFAWKPIKIHFAGSYIIQNMCCTTYSRDVSASSHSYSLRPRPSTENSLIVCLMVDCNFTTRMFFYQSYRHLLTFMCLVLLINCILLHVCVLLLML